MTFFCPSVTNLINILEFPEIAKPVKNGAPVKRGRMLGKQEEERLGHEHNTSKVKNSDQGSGRRKKIGPYVVTFFIMFGIWVVLSGKFDPFHLSLGVISCAIVACLSADLLRPSARGLLILLVRWVPYLLWLIKEIFKANLHVTYLVFHPRMMDLIDPRIIKFQSKLRGDLALVTFANSITLTPGTITVNVSLDGNFKVHAIDKASGEPLPGEMEARVARVFGED